MMPSTGRAAVGRKPTEAVGPAVALAIAGSALLVLRLRLIVYPSAPVLFAAIYALVGVASLAVPMGPQDDRRLSPAGTLARSEEHMSELQSHHDIVCRLLLE